MNAFDPQPAADALMAARRTLTPAGPLPAATAPRDIAQAAAVQYAVARTRGHLPPGGFKIGATGARMQAVLGLSGPAAGYMALSDIHASPARLALPAPRTPAVECEIAVRLGRDLPPGPCTLQQAGQAVAAVAAAIELVENRYGPPPIGDLRAVGTPTLVADQVYHVAAVTGSWLDAWSGLDLVAIEGAIEVDGTPRETGRGGELLGNPLQCLAWLAGSEVAAAFGGLRAGQIVMLGSVTPPVWLDHPCDIRVTFRGLGEATLRLV